jgi:xanthine phosphoribosyltransferase
MQKYYYAYSEFIQDVKALVEQTKNEGFDTLLGISRGGLTLAHFMGEALNLRQVVTLNSIHYESTQKLDSFNIFNIPNLSQAKKVLILDDIIDSGETMVEILKLLKQQFPQTTFQVATLFYKKTALLKADFTIKEAPAWIDFFWEKDLK